MEKLSHFKSNLFIVFIDLGTSLHVQKNNGFDEFSLQRADVVCINYRPFLSSWYHMWNSFYTAKLFLNREEWSLHKNWGLKALQEEKIFKNPNSQNFDENFLLGGFFTRKLINLSF